MGKPKQNSKFAIAGKVVGFEIKDGCKIKYICLETYKGEIRCKPSRELRLTLGKTTYLGDLVFVEGEKRVKCKTGKVKFKAEAITVKQPADRKATEARFETKPSQLSIPKIIAPTPNLPLQETQPIASRQNPKTCILVCQKSDCQKRGSRTICQELESILRDRGLSEEVTVKKLGCIKQCKSGPHLVIMPDKTRYSAVSPKHIPKLIERHFPAVQLENSFSV
jgi:(2Fe-2S) ferredoxin